MSIGQFYHPQTVERRANELLAKYEAKNRVSLTPPIPVERLVEDTLDLQILWDVLPEKENETILAGLAPRRRLIVFNESRLSIFNNTSGLYRTVLAHEIGHWELHVDKATLAQTDMPGIEEQFQFLFRSEEQSWNERNAHLFMSYLLVPQHLLNALIRNVEAFDWPFLYRLREMFDVTISVIRIRLERMGLLYVDENGRIYRSRSEYEGQIRML